MSSTLTLPIFPQQVPAEAAPLLVRSVHVLAPVPMWRCVVEFAPDGEHFTPPWENPPMLLSHGGALAIPPQAGDFLLVVPARVVRCYRDLPEAVGGVFVGQP